MNIFTHTLSHTSTRPYALYKFSLVLAASASIPARPIWHVCTPLGVRMAFTGVEPCSLRLFLYQTKLNDQHKFGWRMGNSSRANESCLTGPCSYSGWGPFLSATQPLPTPGNFTVREYSAEVPILQRLLRTCPHRTADPAAADMFVIPYYFGFASTLAWGISDRVFGPGARKVHTKMDSYSRVHLWRELRHLNSETANRHVFFFTTDLEWLAFGLSRRIGLSLLGTNSTTNGPTTRRAESFW